MKLIDPDQLHFGQQHVGTVELFGPDYHTVPLRATPHYRHLLGDPRAYPEYLERSWAYLRPRSTPADRQAWVQRFAGHLELIRQQGVKEPVRVCRRFDNRMILIDGNHRASICLYLGREVPAVEVDLFAHLSRIVSVPSERFGTQTRGMPYQSLFYGGREIIAGRRRDMQERMGMLDLADIRNRTVLDIGCNLGAASLLAAEAGAARVYGVESVPAIATAAIRLNVLTALPCTYRCAPWGAEGIRPVCDTAFAFSVDRHIGNDAALAAGIRASARSVLYFETHRGAAMPTAIRSICARVEQIGSTDEGRRKLYRCSLK